LYHEAAVYEEGAAAAPFCTGTNSMKREAVKNFNLIFEGKTAWHVVFIESHPKKPILEEPDHFPETRR
jgi:hypothetical protein